METDALSDTLRWLRLKAEVYIHTDFQGCWAVDTSGSRTVPFHLVHSGKSWLHLPGEPPRLLSAGDLVVFPHDSRHYLSSERQEPDQSLVTQTKAQASPESGGEITGLTCGFFEFENKSDWPLLDSLPQAIVLELSDTSRLGNTRTLIQLLVAELRQAESGSHLSVNYLAHVLFIHILRSQLDKELPTGLLKALFSPRIGTALSLIHTQIEKPWTLASLASEAGMSRAVFAAEFKRVTGKTAIAYLAQWRMLRATALLQTTEVSLLTISEQCGYQSEAAFRKAFRQVTGRTPGDVRKAGAQDRLTRTC